MTKAERVETEHKFLFKIGTMYIKDWRASTIELSAFESDGIARHINSPATLEDIDKTYDAIQNAVDGIEALTGKGTVEVVTKTTTTTTSVSYGDYTYLKLLGREE